MSGYEGDTDLADIVNAIHNLEGCKYGCNEMPEAELIQQDRRRVFEEVYKTVRPLMNPSQTYELLWEEVIEEAERLITEREKFAVGGKKDE